MDLLVKELAFETVGKGRNSSMGSNARLLSKAPNNEELGSQLVKYSDFLYTPGKHDFQDMPFGRRHRFSAKEVVLTCYVTARLAKHILDISSAARQAVEKDNLYIMGDGRWGSSSRVKYRGDPLERGKPSSP